MSRLFFVLAVSLAVIVTACNESPSVEWAYTGPGAPEHWASLSPEFAACANGRQQSPIDITGYRAGDLSLISNSLTTDEATLRNDGRQVHVDYAPGNTSVLDRREFSLKSVHFHSPSEHLVDGQSFSAELHMVHTDTDGNLAVVGVLFTLGAPSPTAQSILDAAPPIGNTTSALIPLASSLPTDLSYYRYNGSKTTPPCDEPVDWYVLRQPMSISQDQVDGLLSLSGGPNNRPTQPIGERAILVCCCASRRSNVTERG